MGLDTTHKCWNGPYSSFNIWRNEIAVVAGYELESVWGIGVPKMDWSKITLENSYGEWKETPKDPLVVLLCHSDCEGVIHPEQAVPLANHLEELLGYISDNPLNSHRRATRKFIDGLRLAASRGEDVEFL